MVWMQLIILGFNQITLSITRLIYATWGHVYVSLSEHAQGANEKNMVKEKNLL